MVRAKAEAALQAGLTAIVCVGETRAEREAGRAIEVVSGQVRGSLPAGGDAGDLVVAYEPVWAIGTGLTPTPADVAEMHGAIRALLRRDLRRSGREDAHPLRRLGQARQRQELLGLANVDGALVGGASLKAADFLAIAATYAEGARSGRVKGGRRRSGPAKTKPSRGLPSAGGATVAGGLARFRPGGAARSPGRSGERDDGERSRDQQREADAQSRERGDRADQGRSEMSKPA